MKNTDYIGPIRKRFRLLKLKFSYGRWHYQSDDWGNTLKMWFVWENE